jgi:hypothetical protein
MIIFMMSDQHLLGILGVYILRFTTFMDDEYGQLTKDPEKIRKLNKRLTAIEAAENLSQGIT